MRSQRANRRQHSVVGAADANLIGQFVLYVPYLGDDFRRLMLDIELHPRLCGHYIVGLVELDATETANTSREEILDSVFQHFDPSTWPPRQQRPQDQQWQDYRCSRQDARSHTVQALIGGRFIGHTEPAMDEATAVQLFERFETFFGPQRQYYLGMGLGEQKYTYQHGCAVGDDARLGVFCIAESD